MYQITYLINLVSGPGGAWPGPCRLFLRCFISKNAATAKRAIPATLPSVAPMMTAFLLSLCSAVGCSVGDVTASPVPEFVALVADSEADWSVVVGDADVDLLLVARDDWRVLLVRLLLSVLDPGRELAEPIVVGTGREDASCVNGTVNDGRSRAVVTPWIEVCTVVPRLDAVPHPYWLKPPANWFR